jgi:hypothetical protein
MSNSDMPLPPPASPPRSGCLTALMVMAGIILLLPGLCAVIFGVGALQQGSLDGLGGFIFLGLLVGALGVLMIWGAVRRSNS